MTATKNPPFNWVEVESDVRAALVALASIIEISGAGNGIESAFLGIDEESQGGDISQEESSQSFSLEGHALNQLARRAYDFAYQLGQVDHFTANPEPPFSEESYEILVLLQGFPRADRHGDLSPFDPRVNSPLRTVFETAYARYDLQQGNELSIKQLALLSNMTIPAVRSSISKDGIKTEPVLHSKDALKSMSEEERLGRVSSENAMVWLRGRRGFIPTIDPSNSVRIELMWPAFLKPGADIKEGITKALKVLQASISELARTAEVDAEWLEGLFGEGAVVADVDALQRLAKALRAPAPAFVGGMVQEILARQHLEQLEN